MSFGRMMESVVIKDYRTFEDDDEDVKY